MWASSPRPCQRQRGAWWTCCAIQVRSHGKVVSVGCSTRPHPSPTLQLVVATAATCRGVTISSHLVVIINTQARHFFLLCVLTLPTTPFSPLPPTLQLVVATAATCWGMTISSHLVVIMGTQHYDAAAGAGAGAGADFPVSDLLQMMGRASRPNIDDSGVKGVGVWVAGSRLPCERLASNKGMCVALQHR